MSNNILENNLRLISGYNKKLAEKIANISDLKGVYEIKEAKSGDSILFKDGIPFDDAVDPVWNALERYNKLEEKTNKGITILYGLGLGYVLKEFTRRYKGKIIVYEPNPEVLRIVFELADFSQELANRNVRITADYDDIRAAYLELFFKDYKLNIVPGNYYEIAPAEENTAVKEEIEKIHGIYQSNYRNLMEKGSKWTLSLFNNVAQVYKHQDLHILKDKFKGKTAVIISAGPSLDKNIQELQAYRDKVVVFCVGTALKTALKYGIIPDFAVVIETSPNTQKQLEVAEIGDINVINATNVFNGVFNVKPKCFLNYHLNKDAASIWLGEILHAPVKEYDTAGTVSIIALFSAKMMGMDKIVLIGQDLAYTDNKCYSQECFYGAYKVDGSNAVYVADDSELKNTLGMSDETISKHANEQLGKNLYFIKGQNGQRVLSRSDLILFIAYFEEIAEKYGSEIALVNATEGGAYINGYEHITLKEALEKYTDGAIDKKEIETPLMLKDKDLQKRKDVLLKELRGIVKNSYEIGALAEKIIKNNIFPCLSPETVKKLEEYSQTYQQLFDVKSLKTLNNFQLSPEEKDLIRTEQLEDLRKLYNIDITKLLAQNPKKFSENLTVVKDNYFILKNIVFNNVLIKNYNFGNFLVVDNLIKDFENTDRNLAVLFSKLINLFFFIKLTGLELTRIIKLKIKEIEG